MKAKEHYPAELTPALLHSLVDKIVIHEKTKDADGHRIQKIGILYSFVGANEFPSEYSHTEKSSSVTLLHHAVSTELRKLLYPAPFSA